MPSNPLDLLRKSTGNPTAKFREGQLEAIQHLLNNAGRLLVVEATGWGKSTVYFVTAKILRERGLGTTILISPLIALMRNQLAAAKKMGVKAVTIHSGNTQDWDQLTEQIVGGLVDITLISPERLENPKFKKVLSKIASRVSMLVIDEAHCVSDWGHDFRPDYRSINQFVRLLPDTVRVLATTATANNRVVTDLEQSLGPNLKVQRGGLTRNSLFLQTINISNRSDRYAWLAETILKIEGSGIVYTLTTANADIIAEWLQLKGISAKAYHGGLENGLREDLEDELLANSVKVLIATTALGMGFDKPDLAFVFHEQITGSVVHYYQQVGRAGRSGQPAYGVMLYGRDGASIIDFFIDSAFPLREDAELLLEKLEDSDKPMSTLDLERKVNLSSSVIKKTIKILSKEVPAPVVKEGSKFRRTVTPLLEDFWLRVDRVTKLRKAEKEQMKRYAALASGHMHFLIDALDGDSTAIMLPDLPPLTEEVNPELAREAVVFLKRRPSAIVPRRKWSSGGLPTMGIASNSSIRPEHRLKEGRVLASFADGGWGTYAALDKHKGEFRDELVEASARLIHRWAPDPFPAYITCMPSHRKPRLVQGFAERLAIALGIPFITNLEKTDKRKPQKSMNNSAHQALNLDGALAIIAGSVQPGPVLLVDDMVDSKWTLTVAGYLLLTAGSGPVYPFALASTASSS